MNEPKKKVLVVIGVVSGNSDRKLRAAIRRLCGGARGEGQGGGDQPGTQPAAEVKQRNERVERFVGIRSAKLSLGAVT